MKNKKYITPVEYDTLIGLLNLIYSENDITVSATLPDRYGVQVITIKVSADSTEADIVVTMKS